MSVITEEWISAAEAVSLLKTAGGTTYGAQMSLCKRAHAGLVRSRADQLIIDEEDSRVNIIIPKKFWWAEGHEALKQDWTLGDFETWENHETRYRAFGVKFARSDIEKMISTIRAAPIAPAPIAAPAKGGRHAGDWWDNLLIELCFRYFRGDFKPIKQAEIEDGMQRWMTEHGHQAATSTVRRRAQKLWQAIQRDMVDN
jgi:hypothetical protein